MCCFRSSGEVDLCDGHATADGLNRALEGGCRPYQNADCFRRSCLEFADVGRVGEVVQYCGCYCLENTNEVSAGVAVRFVGCRCLEKVGVARVIPVASRYMQP